MRFLFSSSFRRISANSRQFHSALPSLSPPPLPEILTGNLDNRSIEEKLSFGPQPLVPFKYSIDPQQTKSARRKARRRARQILEKIKENDLRVKKEIEANESVEATWGEDQLKPPLPIVPIVERLTKFIHEPRRFTSLSYGRRTEGIIEPDLMSGTTLEDVTPINPQLPIATLHHNLERVLFNPGVHWLQDSRSRVYNFDPYLQRIPAVEDFAFERSPGFISPSKDPDMVAIIERENKDFTGSTSSLSGMLSHIYFLISRDQHVNLDTLSLQYKRARKTFTPGQRMPSTVVFNYSNGRYSINSSAEKNDDSNKNILIWMGTLLEKFLTMPKEEFATHLRSNPEPPPAQKSPLREAFRFSKSNNFIMRSQLDCHDPRLPGTGVFDIKTRACMPIRLDIMNYRENSGYLIRKQHGDYESFEREYYDLIRSAFLKYQFQVRIGNMDGVIVAYHNTERMFGFQYLPLAEMDERLFGPGEGVGDRVFRTCLHVLENVAFEITHCFPKESVRATFETLEESGKMNVWVQPVEGVERPIKQLQVDTWSYMDNKIAVPFSVIGNMSEKWTLRWAISHLNVSANVIQKEFNDAKQRQFRAWAAPSGVDPDDLKEWYETLNFGGTKGSGAPFNPEKFGGTNKGLELLRQLAREGRRETERLRQLEEGQPRHVLGQI